MIFVVGFLWLAIVGGVTLAIQVSPEAGLRNASNTIIRPEDGFIPMQMNFKSNRTLGSEITSSERTRRLIPYIAFYSGQPEYPINQQYVVQTPLPPPSQQLQYQSSSPQKSQKQQHLPPVIPIPTAYVHMKVPINNQHQQSHHNHHHSPQAVFQTIAYGGQHPLTQVKEKNQIAVKQPQQLQHAIIPPAPVGSHRIHFPFKEEKLPKQKFVGLQQYQQQSQHLQAPPSSIHMQKINMTPFTPTNSVPGRFIPIIYTNEQVNNINYKSTGQSQPSMDPHEQQKQHPQQQQQQLVHQYNEVPSISQMEEHQLQYQSLSSGGHKQQNSEEYLRHRPQGEIVVNIPASPAEVSSKAELVPNSLSQVQQQEHVQYVTLPTPSPSSSAAFQIISDEPAKNHHSHQNRLSHPVQHFSNTENLTQEQKYVIYLRQQLRHKQQQQFQEHQEEHHQLEKNLQHSSQSQQHKYQQQQQYQQQHQQHQQHYQIQQPEQQQNRLYQPEHLYQVSTTVSPVPQPSSTSHPSTYSSVDVHSENHHNQNHFNEKYPQHSPINHAVYQHPDVVTNPEQILHPNKQQPSYPQSHRYPQHQLQPHLYASNPKYVEYVIDDPKQEIEDHSIADEKEQHESIRPPPLQIVKNPVSALPPVEVVVSSPRPLYKNQPTLRLHAISPTTNPSSRPFIQSNYGQKATPAPSMIFVSSKPKHTQLFPTASPRPVKLKPSQKYPVDSTKYVQPAPEQDPLPDIKTSSLAELLRKLQESNHLPQTLTPDNIDNSIRTLIRILYNLKGTQPIVEEPPQHHDQDYDYNNAGIEEEGTPAQQDLTAPIPSAKPGPNSGRPGIDYPTLDSIPVTSFNCQQQRYKGFFGDPETNCQVWHYCDLNGGKASFLCPNGTIFSQIALTCDWWFNVKCATTPQLYVLNERLYKYILPFTPKFPEDYSGPLVDKYLALKFKEMEEKMRRERLKGRGDDTEDSGSGSEEIVTEAQPPSPSSPSAPPPHEDASINVMKNKNEDSISEGISLSAIGEQSSERNLLIDEETGHISSRGSAVDIESSTQDTTKEELPLSQQPIIVVSSTTPSPFVLQSGHDDSNINQPEPLSGNKVSVEKVEVIEIKTDGTSGHLIPNNGYNSGDT